MLRSYTRLTVLASRIFWQAGPNDAGGISDRDGMVRNVTHDDRSSADHSIRADVNPVQDYHTVAQPRTVANARTSFRDQRLIHYQPVRVHAGLCAKRRI